jgi:hypothetical protein
MTMPLTRKYSHRIEQSPSISTQPMRITHCNQLRTWSPALQTNKNSCNIIKSLVTCHLLDLKIAHLPVRLGKCNIPICPSCMYGKMSRIPRRISKQYRPIHPATKPGQMVSVDQLESTAPGVIAQIKGTPTKERFRGQPCSSLMQLTIPSCTCNVLQILGHFEGKTRIRTYREIQWRTGATLPHRQRTFRG